MPRNASGLLAAGKVDREGGARWLRGFHLDPPAVRVHDPFSDAESQTQTSGRTIGERLPVGGLIFIGLKIPSSRSGGITAPLSWMVMTAFSSSPDVRE
jgi:hypothetical protein